MQKILLVSLALLALIPQIYVTESAVIHLQRRENCVDNVIESLCAIFGPEFSKNCVSMTGMLESVVQQFPIIGQILQQSCGLSETFIGYFNGGNNVTTRAI
ncbi:hypothetical protein CHUAL_008276 [Chamberlinius hualienensis]